MPTTGTTHKHNHANNGTYNFPLPSKQPSLTHNHTTRNQVRAKTHIFHIRQSHTTNKQTTWAGTGRCGQHVCCSITAACGYSNEEHSLFQVDGLFLLAALPQEHRLGKFIRVGKMVWRSQRPLYEAGGKVHTRWEDGVLHAQLYTSR